MKPDAIVEDFGVTLDAGLESKGTHHYDRFLSVVHGVVIDHADDGHAEITADAEGDAKSETRQNGNDVAAW